MKIDIGIDEAQRQKIAEGLSKVLADTYALYLKTHAFHWNVTGPQFQALHTLFETQYTELAVAVDDIAERIRALGVFAPGSYSQFARLSSIREETGVPKADDMVRQLAQDNEAVVRAARAVLPVAEEGHDEASVDLLVGRMRTHEKTAWMLRSMVA
ncbi:MAG: DNA starvation/stationary phase protection protein [Planctomycetes bacterium]|nr:DNA starvation/stationary phase protection protein [Planctomycetota bacterium]